MNWILLSVVVLGFFKSNSGSRAIPKYVTICKHDSNLNDCYKNQIIHMMHNLKNGLPEMNLRKVDPLLIEKLNFNIGNTNSLSLKADLKDMKLYGLDSTVPTGVDIDLDKVIFKFNFFVPTLRMESIYKARGKILLLNFDSEGPFWGNFTNIDASGVWTGKKYMKKGKEHLKLENADVNVKIEDIKMHFSNLFPTNNEITETTNKAINENIDELYEEIKPIVVETFRAVVIDATNNVFNLFPMEKLFPKN